MQGEYVLLLAYDTSLFLYILLQYSVSFECSCQLTARIPQTCIYPLAGPRLL